MYYRSWTILWNKNNRFSLFHFGLFRLLINTDRHWEKSGEISFKHSTISSHENVLTQWRLLTELLWISEQKMLTSHLILAWTPLVIHLLYILAIFVVYRCFNHTKCLAWNHAERREAVSRDWRPMSLRCLTKLRYKNLR